MSQLPLLIQEKLDYYLYFQPWQRRIEQVNKEYHENTEIDWYCRIIAWKVDNHITPLLCIDCNENTNCWFRRCNFLRKKTKIIEKNDKYIMSLFKDEIYLNIPLPKRYFFSSGHNNLSGYF